MTFTEEINLRMERFVCRYGCPPNALFASKPVVDAFLTYRQRTGRLLAIRVIVAETDAWNFALMDDGKETDDEHQPEEDATAEGAVDTGSRG